MRDQMTDDDNAGGSPNAAGAGDMKDIQDRRAGDMSNSPAMERTRFFDTKLTPVADQHYSGLDWNPPAVRRAG